MNLLQIILVYLVSWWLVLFMVLPFRAHAPHTPGLGHAPSAPENPMLKKKFIWTSGIAAIVTALLYVLSGYINFAHAAEDIYHASSGVKSGGKCKNQPYVAPADINATEGTGPHGKQVAPATIGGSATAPSVNLGINGDAYVNQPIASPSPAPTPGTTPVNPNSYLGIGQVDVGPNGSVKLDGRPLTSEPCIEE